MIRIYVVGLMTAIFALITSSPAAAQDNPVTVAFSDPSRPGTIKADLLQGAVSITGTSGKDVIISPRTRGTRRPPRRESESTAGLHRLDGFASGLSIEERNNVMTIETGVGFVDLDIQVPARTNLQIKVVNGGSMKIEGADGEIEVSNDNGSISLTDVSGSVVAHSLNGKIIATLKRVTAQKPMSFVSMNGNVDVSLPPDTKANLKLRTDNGNVWTDFDVQMRASSQPVVEDSRKSGGRYRIEVDRSFVGSINGGGPDFELRTMNGNIYIRKTKP